MDGGDEIQQYRECDTALKRRANGKKLEWGRRNEEAGEVRDTEGSAGEVKWSWWKQETARKKMGRGYGRSNQWLAVLLSSPYSTG